MTSRDATGDATRAPADGEERDGSWWPYARAFIAPVLIWALLLGAVGPLVVEWVNGQANYNREAVEEWIEEARNPSATLAELVEAYLKQARELEQAHRELGPLRKDLGGGGFGRDEADPQARRANELYRRYTDLAERCVSRRQVIAEFLRALCEPPTLMYQGQMPLFPIIYRMGVSFDGAGLGLPDLELPGGARLGERIVWDSGNEPTAEALHARGIALRDSGAEAWVVCQVRAWNKRQREDQARASRVQFLMLLALMATVLAGGWILVLHAGERERARQRSLARQKLEQAELQRLEEERRRVETERQLLEQRLATQAAERQALELKSHLYASIGIMAGSYAHNIKNLLVRPNDLLRRCLESPDTGGEQERMLREVQQTLGTVTERLQQILHTVRRDPGQAELRPLDLNVLVRALAQTWGQLAAERWQLDMKIELPEGPCRVRGDDSHLQQAIENLLFNARDATFEMRNHLRDQARKEEGAARRQAVIAAAAWRGEVTIRVWREGGEVRLAVRDNGAGMTEEVRRRCTETHFSTKRDNALYQGHSTGMGLGLSFVVAILEHHHARLEIESAPQRGTTFDCHFPAGE